MNICVIAFSSRMRHNIIEDIMMRYREKVEKCNKIRNEITFVNGDNIAIRINYGGRLDGLRADVAVGRMRDYDEMVWMTRASKETKRIWSYDDLEQYLSEVNV